MKFEHLDDSDWRLDQVSVPVLFGGKQSKSKSLKDMHCCLMRLPSSITGPMAFAEKIVLAVFGVNYQTYFCLRRQVLIRFYGQNCVHATSSESGASFVQILNISLA